MTERRPLASRDLKIIQMAAAWLVAREVSANAISLASMGFAALASLCLVGTAWSDGLQARVLFLLAAGFVQLRLLANLLDGMVAVGSGKASPEGELYNEVPDRDRRYADPDRSRLRGGWGTGARLRGGVARRFRRLHAGARELAGREGAFHRSHGQASAYGDRSPLRVSTVPAFLRIGRAALPAARSELSASRLRSSPSGRQ